jgi:hypothetical protein
MVTADKNTFVSHSASKLLAYFVVGPRVTVVVGDALVESKDILVGHVQTATFDIGKPRAVWRMRVKHTLGGGVANMNCRVYANRGALYSPRAFNHITLRVHHNQIVCGDLRHQQTVSFDKKLGGGARHHESEVIMDSVIKTEAMSKAVGCRQVDPRLMNCIGSRFERSRG